MSQINQIAGYKTSKDYKKLVELMKKQSVICIFYSGSFQEIGQSIYLTYGETGELFRITGDADCWDEQMFINRCKSIKLEFIEPDIIPK